MADRKISDLTALTTPASGDYLPIVDISEVAAASKNKRITIEELLRGAPDGTAAAPSIAFESDPNTGIYSPGADQVAVSTGGTGRLFVDSTGNIGIGTTTPFGKLHIQDDANNVEIFAIGPTTGSSRIRFGDSDDSNIGQIIYDNTNDSLQIHVNNSERLRIDSSGRLGLGTSSPSALLHVNSGGNTVALISSTFSNSPTTGLTIDTTGNSSTCNLIFNKAGLFRGAIKYIHNATGANESLGFNVAGGTDKLVIDGSGNVGIGTTSPGSALEINAAAATSPFIAKINTAEAARIDSSGRLLVGTSTAVATQGVTAQVQNHGISAGQGGGAISNSYWQANSTGPAILLNKSRANTVGTYTIVQDGDITGSLLFGGSDGTAFVRNASIDAAVDGTPGTNDMPGRLVFSTAADGAATPTERLRITSAGVLLVADAGNIAVGTTTGTKIGTATTQKIGFYNATPVVQPTAVADATDAATAITQLNALLTRMRNLGLIAT